MSKTVLVAGGAGFIGSHLCDALLAEENKVICIDNLVTGSRKNIEHNLKNSNFSFYFSDISEPLSLRDKIDEIYNLASPASPIDFSKIPLKILNANSIGSENLLELAKKNNAKYLFASTSEVYGNPLEHPQKETYFGNVNCNGVRSCYDESKRLGETLCFIYRNYFGVDAKIARIFNTYGARMRENDGRVTPNFIMQALKNKPLTIYGTGNQTRSFCYVSDLVKGLILLMNSRFSGPMNLGNPQEITIAEFAKKVIELSKSSSKLELNPLPKDDPMKRKPDISQAMEKLKWEPVIQLEEGLIKTIDYFKSI
ncbi:MAG: SDR family oxidoreductase [Candidatus Diapherotrites archaeon]|nr:SDR family oxidoreductase [Candidatus Diapherotrites archaeon]